jgi:hypothetical protein
MGANGVRGWMGRNALALSLAVPAGKAHALFLIGWNAEREAWLNRSTAVVATEYGFFVPRSDPIVLKETAQLKDYSVSVYCPSNTKAALEKVMAAVPGRSSTLPAPRINSTPPISASSNPARSKKS